MKTGVDDHLYNGGGIEEIEADRSPLGTITPAGDRYTDVVLARHLAQFAATRIRYCEAKACWYVYNAGRWEQGSSNLVKPHVHALARVFHDRAGAEPDPDKRKRYRDQANRLETDRVIRAVINQAMALPGLQIDPRHFDQHRHLLNVANGTIDLRTGVRLQHDPANLMSCIAPVAYEPDVVSDLWEQTVRLAMRGDMEMVDYLQRVLGYGLTGYTTEKAFFDAYGPKDTGKTTIVGAYGKVLGPDYAKVLRHEALVQQREPEKIPHELAGLMGARFVMVSEVPDEMRFNAELLKRLSGGDLIAACFKYGRMFEFEPQFTLILYSNDRIDLGGADDALWERVRSIPFTFNFKTEPGHVHVKDVRLTLEQPEHQQGILAWAVRGALAWREQGLLPTPAKVEADTAAHRAAVNMVAAFVREECEVGDEFSVPLQTFHRAYNRWAGRSSKLSTGKLRDQMSRLGYQPKDGRGQGRNTAEVYPGIHLRDDCAF